MGLPSKQASGWNGWDCQHFPEVARGSQYEDGKARDPVGAFGEALEVRPGDCQLDSRIAVGPRSGLLEVSKGHIPLTNPHVRTGTAQKSLRPLRVAAQCE